MPSFAGLGLEASNGQLGETWASECTGDSQPPGSRELQSCGQSSLDASQSSTGEARSLKSMREPWSVGGQTVEKHRQIYTDSMEVLGKISQVAGGISWPTALSPPLPPSPPLPHPHLFLWRKSDRWGVCTQGNSTALSMTPITIKILFHAEIVLFLAIWTSLQSSPHTH